MALPIFLLLGAGLLLFVAPRRWLGRRWVPILQLAWAAAGGLLLIVAALSRILPPHAPDVRSLASVPHDHWNSSRGWSVGASSAFNGVLVVHVETELPPGREQEIAEEVVTPVQGDYDEVLVYIRRSGDVVVHRVQWTPQGGYTALTFSDQ